MIIPPSLPILTFKEDIETNDPLVPGDVSIIVGVEILEDPVHQDVISHVEAAVEKLTEQFPIHSINFSRWRRILLLEIFLYYFSESKPHNIHSFCHYYDSAYFMIETSFIEKTFSVLHSVSS